MASQIILEAGRPWLVRECDDEKSAQRRYQWIKAAADAAVIGPARVETNTLIRPYVQGIFLDRLNPSQQQVALSEITNTINELHSRGLVHLDLCAKSIVLSGESVHLLESKESRESNEPKDFEQDLLALETLRKRYRSGVSPSSALIGEFDKSLLAKLGVALLGVVALAGAIVALDSDAPTTTTASTSASMMQQPDPNLSPTSSARQLFTATTAQPGDCDSSGCSESVSWSDGVLTVDERQFTLGSPGDQFFYGNWDCAAVASPALLTQGGSLYVFTDWDLPAVRTQIGPGSRAELVSQDGCDGVLVTSPNGDTVRFPTSN